MLYWLVVVKLIGKICSSKWYSNLPPIFGVNKNVFETTSSGETGMICICVCCNYDLNDLRILNGIQFGFLVKVCCLGHDTQQRSPKLQKVQEDTILQNSKIDIQNPRHVICNVLTLPKTNINPRNHGSNRNLLFQGSVFRCDS